VGIKLGMSEGTVLLEGTTDNVGSSDTLVEALNTLVGPTEGYMERLGEKLGL
jgi:hypothetical protein